jgi:hypothetical protein
MRRSVTAAVPDQGWASVGRDRTRGQPVGSKLPSVVNALRNAMCLAEADDTPWSPMPSSRSIVPITS